MAAIEKRKGYDGACNYRAKVRIKGHPAQSKTFKRLTDAKRWAQQTEAAMLEGRYFPKEEARKHTLAEAINRYLEMCLPKKSQAMQEAQVYQLLWWKKEIGSYLLADTTSALITQCRDKLMNENIVGDQKRTPATGNRYLAALSHLFTVALREWEWTEDNPVRRIRRFKEPSGRTRFLDNDERTRLLKECKRSAAPYLYLIVLIAMSTGMRLNEILSLFWTRVSFRDKSVILYRTKNEAPRKVPIHGQALAVLEEHAKVRRIDGDLIFPSPNNPQRPYDIRSAWTAAVRRAKLNNFCFHDLRHTAASYFAMSGASTRDLCDIFGWKKMQMAMRHAHLSEAHTSDLAARMNEKFFAFAAGEETPPTQTSAASRK